MPELNEASFVQMEALNNYAMWLNFVHCTMCEQDNKAITIFNTSCIPNKAIF